VAIKVLHPDVAVAIGLERFQREIEIAAKLQHPHILPLYDSGSAGAYLYYVMRSWRGNRCAISSIAKSSCRRKTPSVSRPR